MMRTVRNIFFIIILGSITSTAWSNAFLRSDQEAAHWLAHKKPLQAAALFTDPEWAAVAFYRAGHYQEALEKLDTLDTAEANYNRGNTLAQLGDFQAAIAAYDRCLQQNPQHVDAKYNRKLVQQLLHQNPPQKNSQSPQSKSSPPPPQKQQNPPSQNSPPPDSPQQNPQQPPSNDKPNKKDPPNNSKNNSKSPESNQPQANDSPTVPTGMREISDDPGGLLRQKFLRDHERLINSE